jgi:lambda repressor-like predicted transcriptional regulator
MLTPRVNFLNRKNIIEKAGFTQTAYAEKMGMSRIWLYKLIHDPTKNEAMHVLMCESLGVSKEVFWPEFYGPDAVGNSSNGDTVSHDPEINDSIDEIHA